jgi:hypothetical protein
MGIGIIVASPIARCSLLTCSLLAAPTVGDGQTYAQSRDDLLNGMVIGAAVGAGAGVAFTHAVRDSDLSFGQYAYGALVFGAVGAGVGLGVDALLDRAWRTSTAGPRQRIRPGVLVDQPGQARNRRGARARDRGRRDDVRFPRRPGAVQVRVERHRSTAIQPLYQPQGPRSTTRRADDWPVIRMCRAEDLSPWKHVG